MEYRYQITCIGGFSNIYIKEEINNNKFIISGGYDGLKVSWQVTGIRKDKYAEKYRLIPEVDKQQHEKGYYLYPELYGFGEEKSIGHGREKFEYEKIIGKSYEDYLNERKMREKMDSKEARKRAIKSSNIEER